MMLVIGAFMIFGIVRMNFQSTSLESEQFMESNTYIQQSTTIARALMDEIQQYKFDAVLNWKRIAYPADLTSCGKGSGEVYPTWNDMDDFHNAVFVSPAPGLTPTNTPPCLWGTEGYTVRVAVQYVNPDNPTQLTWSRTYAKRVTISVANAYSDHVFQTSHVACY
jgi:hypothetical protein